MHACALLLIIFSPSHSGQRESRLKDLLASFQTCQFIPYHTIQQYRSSSSKKTTLICPIYVIKNISYLHYTYLIRTLLAASNRIVSWRLNAWDPCACRFVQHVSFQTWDRRRTVQALFRLALQQSDFGWLSCYCTIHDSLIGWAQYACTLRAYHISLNIMCCVFNHQNNIEMVQEYIFLSISHFLLIRANTLKTTQNSLTCPNATKKCKLMSN
jgi:hypothetical protein